MINEIVSNLKKFPKQSARVFHGRGQNFTGFEGLNVEWYPPYLFVQNFAETLNPTFETQLKDIFETQRQIKSILIQNRTRPELSSYVLCERNE